MHNTTFQAKRQYTFELQDLASQFLGSSWPVSSCLKRATNGAGVSIRHNGESARFHGLQTCQSPWICTVCARRIMAGRKAEIESILTRAASQGWRSLFLTVTLSHHSGSKLKDLLKALTESWRFVFSGDRTGERAPLTRVKAQIKTVEVRYGRNSWHPHLHVLLLVDEQGMSESEAASYEEALAACVFSRYARKVEKLGMRAERAGYEWHPVKIAGAAAHYVTKLENSVQLELTEGEGKESRALSRSYSAFQLLALAERGQTQVYGHDIGELYREFAAATKGKRQVSYSREIKALGVEEKADEDFTEAEQKEETVLAVIPSRLWGVICSRKLRAALLNIADSGDELKVRSWLEALEESAFT